MANLNHIPRGVLAAVLMMLALGCSDDDKPAPGVDAGPGSAIDAGPAPVSDASAVDAGAAQVDAGSADCVSNPVTHLEIINACSDAEKVEKQPVLPLLLLDGGLPQLP